MAGNLREMRWIGVRPSFAKLLILPLLVCLALLPESAQAQFFRSIPSLAYHAIMPRFYEGDYVIAKNAFQQESRLAIKTPQSIGIDSICYQTMVGECYYRTGDLDEALQCYTAAVQLYLSFPNWMQSVQFPDSIRLSNTGRGTPWGTSTPRPNSVNIQRS